MIMGARPVPDPRSPRLGVARLCAGGWAVPGSALALVAGRDGLLGPGLAAVYRAESREVVVGVLADRLAPLRARAGHAHHEHRTGDRLRRPGSSAVGGTEYGCGPQTVRLADTGRPARVPAEFGKTS